MSVAKIVKRYTNRKLYDTEKSCYVTLEDIAAMIKAGDEVHVIDNKSGEDLTSVTLAQIIFETEKKNNFMPLALLRGLIQDGSSAVNEFAQKKVEGVQLKAQGVKETAQKFRSELQDRLGNVMGKAEDEVDGSAGESRPKILAELVATSQKAFEELQRGVEERVKGPAVTRDAGLDAEMQEIRKRMAELEQRLESMPQ